MVNEIRVGVKRRGRLTHWCLKHAQRSVISPVLKLAVDLGHVTGLVVDHRDWMFWPCLVRSNFSLHHVGGAVLGLPGLPLDLTTHRGWC